MFIFLIRLSVLIGVRICGLVNWYLVVLWLSWLCSLIKCLILWKILFGIMFKLNKSFRWIVRLFSGFVLCKSGLIMDFIVKLFLWKICCISVLMVLVSILIVVMKNFCIVWVWFKCFRMLDLLIFFVINWFVVELSWEWVIVFDILRLLIIVFF